MPERSFEEFLTDLNAKAAEQEEAEKLLLQPPKVEGTAATLIGSRAVSFVRQQATTRLSGSLPQSPPEDERPRFCRHCGAALKPDGRFCTKCGKPIDV